MSVHKHEEGAALLFLCGQKLRKCLRHPLSTMEQTKGSLLHCCSNSSILYAPIWLIETILSLPYCFDSGGYHPVSASSLLFFLCWNWPRCCSDISWFIGWILTLELTKPCTIWLNTDNRYKILNSSSLISILCHLVDNDNISITPLGRALWLANPHDLFDKIVSTYNTPAFISLSHTNFIMLFMKHWIKFTLACVKMFSFCVRTTTVWTWCRKFFVPDFVSGAGEREDGPLVESGEGGVEPDSYWKKKEAFLKGSSVSLGEKFSPGRLSFFIIFSLIMCFYWTTTFSISLN